MHTYSKKWFKKNYVKFGLYKHTTGDEGVFIYEVPCIHDCKYWSFSDLNELQHQIEYRFAEELELLEPERWYIATVRRINCVDNNNDIEVCSIIDVSDEKDDKLRTH